MQSDRASQFMEVYRPVAQRLERYCLMLTGDVDDARDLAGDTVEQAWKGFDGVRDRQAFLAFLFTIASRRWARIRHGRRGRVQVDEASFDDVFDTSQDVERQTDARMLYEALQTLPAEQREVIVLSEIFDMSARDIAAVAGCTEVTVRVRLHRAKARLRRLVGAGDTLPAPVLKPTPIEVDR